MEVRAYSDFELSRNPELRRVIEEGQRSGNISARRWGSSGGRAGGGGGGIIVDRVDRSLGPQHQPQGGWAATAAPFGERQGGQVLPEVDVNLDTGQQPAQQPAQQEASGPLNLTTPSNPGPTPTNLQELLAYIRSRESGGRYDVAYGGRQLPANGPHPGARARVAGPEGPTSAFGAYQFQEGTWRDAVRAGVVPDQMTPENQDRAAAWLADRDYRARTGRNIQEDLADPNRSASVLQVLSPTWTSLRSGQGGAPDPQVQQASTTPRLSVDPLTTQLSVDNHPAVRQILEQSRLLQQRMQVARQYGQIPEGREIEARNVALVGQLNQARGAAALSQFATVGNTQGLTEVLTLYNGGIPTVLQPTNEADEAGNPTFVVLLNGQNTTRTPLSAAEVISEMQKQLSPEYQASVLEHQVEMQQAQFESDLELRNSLATGDQQTQREIYSRLLQGQSAFAVEQLRARHSDVQFQQVGESVLAIYRDENGNLQQQEFYAGDIESPSTEGRNQRETRQGVLSGQAQRLNGMRRREGTAR